MSELINPIVITLMKAFPQSFINYNSEFVVDSNTNQFFRLNDCHSELDIKCKVLEWLSRAAFKTQLSHSERKNRELQDKMRKHINEYLGTSFTVKEHNQGIGKCPVCETELCIEDKHRIYCPNCGQAIDCEAVK